MGKRKKIKVKGEFKYCLTICFSLIIWIVLPVLLSIFKPKNYMIYSIIWSVLLVMFNIVFVLFKKVRVESRINKRFKKNIDSVQLKQAKVVGFSFFEDYRRSPFIRCRTIWVEVEIENKIYKMMGIQNRVHKYANVELNEEIDVYSIHNCKYVKSIKDFKALKKSIEKKQAKNKEK